MSKAYTMTRDGFTFLAMGFTGKKAAGFKEAYIQAFNRMEQELQAPAELTRLEILQMAIESDPGVGRQAATAARGLLEVRGTCS
jgi:phage regulator Rha-like protein